VVYVFEEEICQEKIKNPAIDIYISKFSICIKIDDLKGGMK